MPLIPECILLLCRKRLRLIRKSLRQSKIVSGKYVNRAYHKYLKVLKRAGLNKEVWQMSRRSIRSQTDKWRKKKCT